MGWVLFDEADHRTPVPHFRLPSIHNRWVALDDYRGRDPLVVFFAHDQECASCRLALQTFASRRSEYDQLGVVLLAIFPNEVESLKADPFLLDLPFPVLSDRNGAARHKLAGLMDASLVTDQDNLIFVLDEYGGPYAAFIAAELSGTAYQDEVLQWLEYIQSRCPE